MLSHVVIPAKAGTQTNENKNWTPASAGVTRKYARVRRA